ncbi:hypothetical protein FisN_1Lh485 [Fistulifera solaris]|uniref:Uncharacterized protein n=1 Tax=Fistulifera solaris TaxID=1519565 RepID=A0A1Z5K157_FISSO|nr:hypothetical protein FisN_1Lh485 [Fistulifera solaris]|eukprot:GAX20034.1 hypothetical protein FisN_1Lh485 [Fistulifera solaris]
MRRLSDADVRSIFVSLHHGTAPPNHLRFQIVPVGPTGLKLSPPAFEFEDGLYVLLRPAKKRKQGADDQPKVPRHLRHLVMEDDLPEVCPWSLSGPQFPQPTAIQQRYCYPKGRADYSKQKGGALWTMYAADGKEDVEYRLLHVYYSAKRATNKISASDGGPAKSSNAPVEIQASKRQKVLRLPSSASSRTKEHDTRHHYVHPVAPAFFDTSPRAVASSAFYSVLSFERNAPPSQMHPFPGTNYVTPNGSAAMKHTPQRHVEDCWIKSEPIHNKRPIELLSFTHTQVGRCQSKGSNSNTAICDSFSDNLSLDLSASWQDLDCSWEDPLMDIVNHSSKDSSASGDGMDQTDIESLKSDFSNRLQRLKQALLESIVVASIDDQDELLQILDGWGQTITNTELPFPLQSSYNADDEGIGDFLIDDDIHPVHYFNEVV